MPVRDKIYWSLFLGTLNISLRDRLSFITLTWSKRIMYVAEYRDWWWTNVRETKDPEPDRKIIPPGEGVHPYPEPKTRIASRPVRDGGNNFGRIARLGTLMDDYVVSMSTLDIAGIPARHWVAFFREHVETRNPDKVFGELRQRLTKLGRDEAAADEIVEAINNIIAQIK